MAFNRISVAGLDPGKSNEKRVKKKKRKKRKEKIAQRVQQFLIMFTTRDEVEKMSREIIITYDKSFVKSFIEIRLKYNYNSQEK